MLELFKLQVEIVAGIATGVIGLFVLVFTGFFSVFSLYQRNWSRRFHRKLVELRGSGGSQTVLADYLEEEIYLEKYRIASGVRTNRVTADALMRLAATGHWNRYQIQAIAKFIKLSPEMPAPEFKITVWQSANAFLSWMVGCFLVLVGSILAVAVLIMGVMEGELEAVFAIFLSLALMVVFTLGAAFAMSHYQSYCIYRKFGKYLEQYPEVFAIKCGETAQDPTSQ